MNAHIVETFPQPFCFNCFLNICICCLFRVAKRNWTTLKPVLQIARLRVKRQPNRIRCGLTSLSGTHRVFLDFLFILCHSMPKSGTEVMNHCYWMKAITSPAPFQVWVNEWWAGHIWMSYEAQGDAFNTYSCEWLLNTVKQKKVSLLVVIYVDNMNSPCSSGSFWWLMRRCFVYLLWKWIYLSVTSHTNPPQGYWQA